MNTLRLAILLMVALVTTACEKKNEFELPKLTGSEAAQTGKLADSASGNGALAQEAQIGRLDRDLNLRVEAQKQPPTESTGGDKNQHDEKTTQPEASSKAANQTTADLKSAIAGQWATVKATLNRWLEHLKKSLNNVNGGS